MANFYPDPVTDPVIWSTSNWGDGADAEPYTDPPPGALDTAFFQNAGGAEALLDQDISITAIIITHASSIVDFAHYEATIAGNITTLGGTLLAGDGTGAATITAAQNFISAPNLTLSNNLNWTIPSGTFVPVVVFDTNSYELILDATGIGAGSPTVTELNLTVAEGNTGTLWKWAHIGDPCTQFKIQTSCAIEIDGQLFTEKFVSEGNASMTSGFGVGMIIVADTLVSYWTQSGSDTIELTNGVIFRDVVNPPNNIVDVNSDIKFHNDVANKTLALLHNINSNSQDVGIQGTGDNIFMHINMNGNSLFCTDLILGESSAQTAWDGRISMGGASHAIDGDIKLGGGVGNAGVLNFENCYIQLKGDITGDSETDFTMTANANVVRIVSPVGETPSLTNCAPSAVIYTHDCTLAGTTDTNFVKNNTEAYPNLKATAMVA